MPPEAKFPDQVQIIEEIPPEAAEKTETVAEPEAKAEEKVAETTETETTEEKVKEAKE